MGGLKRGYRYPHCIAQNSRPSDPPGGSAFTAQIEEGKGGMTGLLVHPLSPKVIFYLCGAVPGGGDCLVSPKCLLALIQLLSQRAKEGIASDHSLKMHLREGILLQTVL